MRELTALNYMNSQKGVLEELLEAKKISSEIYIVKSTQIEEEFKKEMIKISELKKVLF